MSNFISTIKKKPPRLSSYIRAYGNVSYKYEEPKSTTSLPPPPPPSSETVSWASLCNTLEEEGKVDPAACRKVRELVLEVVGTEETSAQVDDACIHLFQTFVGQKSLSLDMFKSLKLKYGGLSQSLAQKIFASVRDMSKNVPQDILENVLNDNEVLDDGEEGDYFGKNIPFTYPTGDFWSRYDLSYLSEITPPSFSLDSQITFDIDQQASIIKNSTEKETSGVDTGWLEETLKKCYGEEKPLGMSVQEFAILLLEKLSSGKSAEELQTELFDLCGFERFDMIGAVLENREALVKSLKQNKMSMKAEIVSAAASLAGDVGPSRPNYGCQVTVQSEEEKALHKQMRKEEKKINKLLSKAGVEEEEELEFDPVDLRTKRQAALANAINTPLFKERQEVREMSAPKEQYPYVFDSLCKARLTTGFIQGTKMSLPAGFTRKDDKKWEEVTVPAQNAGTGAQETGKKPVPISSLDEVGKLAFKGIKNLNMIQSVVFDTAYRTSENMLVCAPTGAGKTNVAMLTIVQCIKQNMEAGVIKKDKFKIVYVAPMKALAAEMAAGFGRRLEPLGITVKELTGDMSLTKTEISNTQMLVTTPEKWDVVTRKPGDVGLAALVRLLIIDEVHLLHGDRGPVVEALVARTLRLVESSQTVIRVVGLSATLPNYIDVSVFLRVNPYVGLFFFDGRFRPVPLAQTFIGVKQVNPMRQRQDMDEICYDKTVEFVRAGHQVMIFVHARNATTNTAMVMKEMAQQNGDTGVFEPENNSQLGLAKNAMQKSRNRQLQELFPAGFGIHHAGMLRSDRNLVEKYFASGQIRVLVCTATLAWGVNLPAHAVIIKGTEIYNAKQGNFVDVGILDVLQIFGRAGRPQFDKSGHGTIITSHDKLAHYLSLLTNQFPIESNFIAQMTDNLNAEISLGTVTNMEEAIAWLSYSYLYVRMRKNPQVYGIKYQELREDPTLLVKRREIINDAAKRLDKAKMIRYDESNGIMSAIDLGRTASHFYIKYDTVEVFNDLLKNFMNEGEILAMISQAQEFEQLKVRDDEMNELDEATHDYCELPVKGGAENVHGKVNILLQTFISRGRVKSFSLISDMTYITQNAARIARALFEIVLRKNLPLLAGRMLRFAKTVEKQMWDFEHPLKQHPVLKPDLVAKLENRNFTLDKLRELDGKEIGHLIHHVNAGHNIKRAAEEIPLVELEASIQPITRTVLRVRLTIKPDFKWNDKVHGKTSEPFWVWVEDPANDHMYHNEYFLLTKKQVITKEAQELCFTIPIFEPLPTQYYVRAISDRWIGSESTCAISFKHLILPERHPPHTDLLDLQPLPIQALKEPNFEQLYSFSHFNPIQTQLFHALYHSDKNVLLGAPTGSGKTIVAELAMFRVFKQRPKAKVVYIAPMKALVRERMSDWKKRLEIKLEKKVVELTGDVTPDAKAIAGASVIVTTPEKWDGVSRSWQTRNFVQDVALIVIDEIHLLGEDRGPVLEVIVSRTNFISSHTEQGMRVVGLSTALANARDLADWLSIGQMGLYNFRPSVRPVPLECHISGYPGKHYCPRMALMNKPAFQGIKQHSPTKPSLIFVSSRRQTRLTALDMIAFLAGEENPRQWLHMDVEEMDRIISTIKDQNLRLTLAFGIGIHHAGLVERDRKTVEELYVNMKIQVLVATATLAWGVNFPTHLVIVKGTEFYDGKLKRYVDMPITDVLQMIGRAGRPQYDHQGVAMVLVHDVKKGFYKKFLYEPFPVESSLLSVLADHMNAELVAGTIQSRQDALDYMTWTFFFRRLVQNPSYYGMEDTEEDGLNSFLSGVVGKALDELEMSYCLETGEDGRSLISTVEGRIASYYYLSHTTLQYMRDNLVEEMSTEQVLQALVDATEFSQLPVRHNEDNINTELAKQCPLKVNPYTMDSPHTKTSLLLQSHFSRLTLPCSDYLTDTKSVMDNAPRVLQAMIDICAESGWLASTLRVLTLLQMIVQARWDTDSSLLTLPHLQHHMLYLFSSPGITNLPQLVHKVGEQYEALAKILRPELEEQEVEDVWAVVKRLPIMTVMVEVNGSKVNVGKQMANQNRWIKVTAGSEVTISITMRRLNRLGKEGVKVHAPKYQKPKDEGWVVVVGSPDTRELVALKRIGAIRGSTTFSVVVCPEELGKIFFTLYVMSDSYQGLDQQYELPFHVEQGEEEIYYSD